MVLSPQGWERLSTLIEQGNPDPVAELEAWSHWKCEPMTEGRWRVTRVYPEVKAK